MWDREFLADEFSLGDFHFVSLAVIEGDGFNMFEPIECPGDAGGGVLAAGEHYQGFIV